MIFGGEAFADWIGEISMMKDLTKSMEISMREEEENPTGAAEEVAASTEAAAQNESATGTTPATENNKPQPPPRPHVDSAAEQTATAGAAQEIPIRDSKPVSTSPAPSGASTPRPQGVPTRLAITDRTEEEAAATAAGMTEEEKKLREKEKRKGGLSKEQREELAAFEMERKKIRDERIDTLAKKLVDRLSVWTETDKNKDVTDAFREKMRLEVENLKMESFGINILHAIGEVYISKASTFIKSQKPVIGGVSGFFSRLKDKGNFVKDTWGTVSSAISAQMEIEAMAKAEEEGGDTWTDEKRAEYEKRVTGKILAAAWRGSKFEIAGVLRDVCDKVLYDKNVKTQKRVERAHGLLIIGEMFAKVSPGSGYGCWIVANNVLFRPSATQTKRAAITWHSSSSWPRPPLSGRRRTTRRKRRTRSTVSGTSTRERKRRRPARRCPTLPFPTMQVSLVRINACLHTMTLEVREMRHPRAAEAEHRSQIVGHQLLSLSVNTLRRDKDT